MMCSAPGRAAVDGALILTVAVDGFLVNTFWAHARCMGSITDASAGNNLCLRHFNAFHKSYYAARARVSNGTQPSIRGTGRCMAQRDDDAWHEARQRARDAR